MSRMFWYEISGILIWNVWLQTLTLWWLSYTVGLESVVDRSELFEYAIVLLTRMVSHDAKATLRLMKEWTAILRYVTANYHQLNSINSLHSWIIKLFNEWTPPSTGQVVAYIFNAHERKLMSFIEAAVNKTSW